MVFTVVGVAHRKGEFNGNRFDNFHVYATRDALLDKDETGVITKEYKIPAVYFEKNQIFVFDTFDDKDVSYDAYKRVKSLK